MSLHTPQRLYLILRVRSLTDVVTAHLKQNQDFGRRKIDFEAIFFIKIMNFDTIFEVLETFFQKSGSENPFQILKSGPENP